MPMQNGKDWYMMVALPWQLPSPRTTHTWTGPLLSALGMWNFRLVPVLLQTGDLSVEREANTVKRPGCAQKSPATVTSFDRYPFVETRLTPATCTPRWPESSHWSLRRGSDPSAPHGFCRRRTPCPGRWIRSSGSDHATQRPSV